MAERIDIDANVLGYHAGRVDQVAANVSTASAAVDSMNLGGGAFGLMCAFLVPPVLVATTAAGLAVNSTERLLQRSTRELRGAVSDFSRNEDDAVRRIENLRRSLDQAGD